MSKVLAITGMHRSGTSVIAGYLQYCGLHIGNKLIGPSYGNPHGHFEDAEIEALQEAILSDNGVALRINSDLKLTISKEKKQCFSSLAKARMQYPAWGWKDPRTCLFLDLWKKEIPDLKVLGLFRNWSDVLNSLVNRDLKQEARWPKSMLVPIWHSASNTWLMNRYLETWIRYNTDLLQFALSYPDDVLIVSLNSFDQQAFWEQINNRWNMDLEGRLLSDKFKPSDFRTAPDNWKNAVNSVLAEKADNLFAKLRERLTISKNLSS